MSPAIRRFAPWVFAALTVLMFAERQATAWHAQANPPPAALQGIAPLPQDADCLPRAQVLGALSASGTHLAPEAPPFCTTRPDLTDWIAAAEPGGIRHLAFDGAGCLALWQPSETCQ